MANDLFRTAKRIRFLYLRCLKKNSLAHAKELLLRPECPALALDAALSTLYGSNWPEMERESLIIGIESDHEMDIPEDNEDKIFAIKAFHEHPHFYVSVPVFAKTVSAWAHEISSSDNLNELDVKEICWGVLEAALMEDPSIGADYGDEVRTYIAHALFNEGMVVAPMFLGIFQEDLDEVNVPTGLGPAVMEAFNSIGPDGESLPNDPTIRNQVLKMLECKAYCQIRLEELEKALIG